MEPSESITNPQGLDETVYKFTEACNTAFKVACPPEKPRGRTQQLSILRTNCRCLFNRAKAGNEDTNWLNYKYELASYKKAIKKSKRTAWQTFCSDIQKTTDDSRLRKILSKTSAPLGYLQKANGSWSDSSKECLDLLLDAHFPGSQKAGHSPKGSSRGNRLRSTPIRPQHEMVHSQFQTIQIAGTGRDNTGSHPTSRTNSHNQQVYGYFPIHPIKN